ncbi:MAG: recombination regulator RecX [Burkholderiales bacterium]|jgi:regulatory protein|nr:recombination regulator RecX [Burkholderiales bacterium]
MKKKCQNIRQTAIRLLAKREYGRAELEQRLLRGDADSAEVNAVLNDLVAHNFLSDERFAETIARRKQGKFSKRAIARQLKERGVDQQTTETALASLGNASEEEEALALWRQRFGKLPEGEKEKNKQIRFLASRGFSLSAIFKMLKEEKGREEE